MSDFGNLYNIEQMLVKLDETIKGFQATSKFLQKSKAISWASSRPSRWSAVSSARIAVAAKRASLTAQTSVLWKQQALQRKN